MKQYSEDTLSNLFHLLQKKNVPCKSCTAYQQVKPMTKALETCIRCILMHNHLDMQFQRKSVYIKNLNMGAMATFA